MFPISQLQSKNSLYDLRFGVDKMMEQHFQKKAKAWYVKCFGHDPEYVDPLTQEIVNPIERRHRFLEEALELDQADGGTLSEVIELACYVHSREVGQFAQEVGGVKLTLAMLCEAHNVDMQDCAERELRRVWSKIDVIRQKEAAKPDKNGPLPGGAIIKDAGQIITALRQRVAELETQLQMATTLQPTPKRRSSTAQRFLGRVFGQLTVLEYFSSKNTHHMTHNGDILKGKRIESYCHCRCTCGKELKVPTKHLVLGNVKSCGCTSTVGGLS